MRVGVEATCWHNRRGYGRHARALLRALVRTDPENRYTLFTDSEDHAEPPPEGCEVRLLRAEVPASVAASADGHRSIRDMYRMSRAMSAPEFDVLLFPTIYSFVPTFSRARKLVVIHDVIAETYPRLTVPRPAARLFWNTKVLLGRWQADALVTVSDYSRERILSRFQSDPRRVFVVGEAADPVFRRLPNPALTPRLRECGIDAARRMVAYVGGFSPHKNLEALLDAFAAVAGRPGFEDAVLVMVGDTSNDVFHTYFGTVAARARELGLGDRVVFTGYLPDEDLCVLLNLSAVLVLPSLMEGFGLPAVEAAACGCPVIATTASPLPRLLGAGGMYIDPRGEDIARALQQVLADGELRCRMREAAQAAAARLTWEDAARQMRDAIREVARQ